MKVLITQIAAEQELRLVSMHTVAESPEENSALALWLPREEVDYALHAGGYYELRFEPSDAPKEGEMMKKHKMTSEPPITACKNCGHATPHRKRSKPTAGQRYCEYEFCVCRDRVPDPSARVRAHALVDRLIAHTHEDGGHLMAWQAERGQLYRDLQAAIMAAAREE